MLDGLLAEDTLAGHYVVVEDGFGADERRVLKAIRRGVVLEIDAVAEFVDGLWRRDAVGGERSAIEQADVAETVLTLVDFQERTEAADGGELYFVAMGQHFPPVLAPRRGGGGTEQAEVASAIVDAEVEPAALVRDIVFDFRFAPQQQLQRMQRTGGGQPPHFTGGGAVRFQKEPFAAARLTAADVEAFVVLLEDELVFALARAEAVTPEAMGTLGGVQRGVEERQVVGGPFARVGGGGERVRQQLAGAEVLHLQRVDLVAFGVGRVGEQRLAGTDGEDAQPPILFAVGELVAIEQNFFKGAGLAPAAAIDVVLEPFFGAGKVLIRSARRGRGDVVLLQAGHHFAIEFLAQRGAMLGLAGGVGVLGFEVSDDFGIGFFAEPEVIVQADVAMEFQAVGFLRSGRREHHHENK